MKKFLLLTIVFAFALGTIAASLPAAEARTDIRFYVWNSATSNNIYPSKAVGTAFFVEVWVDAPETWTNMPQGVVQYALSVRVNPNALEVVSASQIPLSGGWLNLFINTYGDGSGFTWADLGYTVGSAVGLADKVTGTIPDFTEYIVGAPPIPAGAGGTGGPFKLMRIGLKSRSDTLSSVIDICGRPVEGALEVKATLWFANGDVRYVDIMDDGFYISTITDQMYADLTSTLDVAHPQGSKWAGLWPSTSYTLTNWIDIDLSTTLSATDEIALTNDATQEVTGWTVNWLSPTPTAGDGRMDMTLTAKGVPEFPLGIGILMIVVAAIPVTYIWRMRPKRRA